MFVSPKTLIFRCCLLENQFIYGIRNVLSRVKKFVFSQFPRWFWCLLEYNSNSGLGSCGWVKLIEIPENVSTVPWETHHTCSVTPTREALPLCWVSNVTIKKVCCFRCPERSYKAAGETRATNWKNATEDTLTFAEKWMQSPVSVKGAHSLSHTWRHSNPHRDTFLWLSKEF